MILVHELAPNKQRRPIPERLFYYTTQLSGEPYFTSQESEV